MQLVLNDSLTSRAATLFNGSVCCSLLMLSCVTTALMCAACAVMPCCVVQASYVLQVTHGGGLMQAGLVPDPLQGSVVCCRQSTGLATREHHAPMQWL